MSLDIALGAIVLLRLAANILQVHIDTSVYLILAISLWLIYTYDHLKDAQTATHISKARYVFHLQHAKIITYVAICIFLALGVITIGWLQTEVLLIGLLISTILLLYFKWHPWLAKIGLKEGIIAIIYTFSILFVPFLHLGSFHFSLFLVLLLLAFANLLLFSKIELQSDQMAGFDSIYSAIGNKKADTLVLVIISGGLLLSVFLTLDTCWYVFFLCAFGIYLILFFLPAHHFLRKKYRTILDSVFLLPLLTEWVCEV